MSVGVAQDYDEGINHKDNGARGHEDVAIELSQEMAAIRPTGWKRCERSGLDDLLAP